MLSTSLPNLAILMSADQHPLHRIEAVLSYIHQNLESPLTVEELAQRFGWSRWQLQRVFTAQTGQSVAHYVRELRLSRAAEALVGSRHRQIDIALSCGFESEISFNRAFKQVFGCTPGAYRRRGLVCGLKTPIRTDAGPLPPVEVNPRLLQIRVETRPAFEVVGLCGQISGLFSPCPNFATQVPRLWRCFLDTARPDSQCTRLGVLEVGQSADNGQSFPYWAAVEAGSLRNISGLRTLTVPTQQYAVIPFQGPIDALEKTLNWFIRHWLPGSGFRGRYGYDLEVYDQGFDLNQNHTRMEYWVPIEPESGSPRPAILPL